MKPCQISLYLINVYQNCTSNNKLGHYKIFIECPINSQKFGEFLMELYPIMHNDYFTNVWLILNNMQIHKTLPTRNVFSDTAIFVCKCLHVEPSEERFYENQGYCQTSASAWQYRNFIEKYNINWCGIYSRRKLH